MKLENPQLAQLIAIIRHNGFDVRLNWEAPRWKGDRGQIRHYSVTDAEDGRKPSCRTFVVIDYEGEGYGFYPEASTNLIYDDVEHLLCMLAGEAKRLD